MLCDKLIILKMIYKQVSKPVIAYDFSNIIVFHKYAYYGHLKLFKNFATKDLIDNYFESIYYCIDYGCKRNFEFAEYILKNVEFVDIKYKMSITATYIRNGKYDPDLYIDKFNYSLYKNISKQTILPLVKHKELHNILKFISVLNSFDLEVECTYLYPIDRLKYNYNLPDNSQSKKISDFSGFILSFPKYTDEDLDPYMFKVPPGDYKNICNIERELLKVYLDTGHKEDKKLSPINEVNIMNDVRFAIEAYSLNKYMDTCLSKFIFIAPKQALKLVKKYKPFLEFGNTVYDYKYLDKYIEINPLYRHNFIYNDIMYHHFNFKQYLGEELDYCYIEACIKSCNFSTLLFFKLQNRKFYKKVDYRNNKYIDSNDEIIVNYDEIFNKLKFDISAYKYLS